MVLVWEMFLNTRMIVVLGLHGRYFMFMKDGNTINNLTEVLPVLLGKYFVE
jgi:hypothetical protein